MTKHTHLCEYCGKERQCRCEDLAELQALPCDRCLDETFTPPWVQKPLSEPTPGTGRAKRHRSGA
jgi:hypothetical protein